jgi:uncharacterized coiled-coil DUF342 family protein
VAEVIPDELAGKALMALMLALQSIHVYLSRRNAKRLREPGEDRRNPPEYDPQQIIRMELAIESLRERMEESGDRMSKLGTRIQALPHELRRDFLGLELGREYAEQCKGERVVLRAEIKELRAELRDLQQDFSDWQKAAPWPKRIDRNRS